MSEIRFECEKCEAELEAVIGDACIAVYPCQYCNKKLRNVAENYIRNDGEGDPMIWRNEFFEALGGNQ